MTDAPIERIAVPLAFATVIAIAAFFVLRRRAGPSRAERDEGDATGHAIELAPAAPHCAKTTHSTNILI